MKILTSGLAATALALALAACSSDPAGNMAAEQSANGADMAAAAVNAPEPSPAPNSSAPATPAAANVLTLEGLGALRIGAPLPANSGWAEHGAQISDACRTISSPDVPGAYAIVEGGRVRRITLGERSTATLAEGIGVGAAEKEVRAAFPGFRATPHKYVEAPGKYLTAPNAESGDPALRFEIGTDGKVSLIHVGTKPALYYIEGCA